MSARQKVLITPDISGKIEKVVVKEGPAVNPGDVLFEIDPVPFRLAVAQAKASLAQANVTYDNLIADLKIYGQMSELSQQGMDLKRRDVERKSALVKNNFGSQLDLDNASTALVTASAQFQLLQQKIATASATARQSRAAARRFPPYAQAKAALDQAQRNLDHDDARADGIAAQVEQIQLGRFVMAVRAGVQHRRPSILGRRQSGGIRFHAVADRPVRHARGLVPIHPFKGTVGSLSPGTGAQFAILPPQNASGNFVKVVQRVPVRIYFDKNDKFVRKLKAGMSVYATIDTNHRRSLYGPARPVAGGGEPGPRLAP